MGQDAHLVACCAMGSGDALQSTELWGGIASCEVLCCGAGCTPCRAPCHGSGPWYRHNAGHRTVGHSCERYGAKPHSTGLRCPTQEPRCGAEPGTIGLGGAVGQREEAENVGSPWVGHAGVHPPPRRQTPAPKPALGRGGERASVSPHGQRGTAQMLPAALGFGTECFRIPSGTRGPRCPPHHRDAKPHIPAAAWVMPWGLTAHRPHREPPAPTSAPGWPRHRPPTRRCPPPPPDPYRRRRFSRNCSMVTSSSRTKSALPNSGPSSSAMPRPPRPQRTHFPPHRLPAPPTTAEAAAQARGRTRCHHHHPWVTVGWHRGSRGAGDSQICGVENLAPHPQGCR